MIDREPSAMPDLLHDRLPLLTETVSEPDLPVLSEMLEQQMEDQAAGISQQLADSAPVMTGGFTRSELEGELHAAARLIVQEIIDEYMLEIENELHRRLEEHLAMLLISGRR